MSVWFGVGPRLPPSADPSPNSRGNSDLRALRICVEVLCATLLIPLDIYGEIGERCPRKAGRGEVYLLDESRAPYLLLESPYALLALFDSLIALL